MLKMVKKNPIHCQSECKLFHRYGKQYGGSKNNEILAYHIIQQSHFYVYILTTKKWKTVYINEMYAIHVYSSIIRTTCAYAHTHIYIYVYTQSHIYPHSFGKNTNVLSFFLWN